MVPRLTDATVGSGSRQDLGRPTHPDGRFSFLTRKGELAVVSRLCVRVIRDTGAIRWCRRPASVLRPDEVLDLVELTRKWDGGGRLGTSPPILRGGGRQSSDRWVVARPGYSFAAAALSPDLITS